MKIHNFYVNDKPLPETKPLLKEVYAMDDTISKFADKLQIQLQTGNVDIYEEKPPLTAPKESQQAVQGPH